MSTNYYLRNARRLPRFEEEPEVHIGMAARGWAFAVHAIPELGINSLEDWRERYRQDDVEIVDEYGRTISASEMDRIIMTSSLGLGSDVRRARVDGRRCIGDGIGPWQMFTGDFC